MAQAGNVILGRFEELIRMYKAPPAHALTEEFYETDPKRDFARGFAVQTVGPLPIAFAKQIMAAKQVWGWGIRRNMMDYNHWAPLGLLGEILPWEDNRVELASGPDEKDRFGLPVAKVTFSLKENDKKMIEFGKNKVMEIMHAAGAKEIVQESRYAHLVGAARMSADPATGVCDKFGRTWDIDNLFVMDGSVMPTQGSANPGLTIQALAARTAGLSHLTASIHLRGTGARPYSSTRPHLAFAPGYVEQRRSSLQVDCRPERLDSHLHPKRKSDDFGCEVIASVRHRRSPLVACLIAGEGFGHCPTQGGLVGTSGEPKYRNIFRRVCSRADCFRDAANSDAGHTASALRPDPAGRRRNCDAAHHQHRRRQLGRHYRQHGLCSGALQRQRGIGNCLSQCCAAYPVRCLEDGVPCEPWAL